MAQMLMSSSKAVRPAGIQHKAPATPSRCVRIHALSTSSSSSGLNRRDMMAAGMAMLGMLPSWGASAEPCAIAEDEAQGDDCRKAALQKDGGVNVDYNKKSNEKKFTAAGGVPVSVLDDEYSRVTFKLADDIQLYASSDVEDYKQRIPLIKTLKTDATNWVSKYARGGSARKESSRRMYIAVDSVIGHIASQGYAPMPAKKLDKVLSTIEQAKGLMAEGK